jgi:hypothetical protein
MPHGSKVTGKSTVPFFSASLRLCDFALKMDAVEFDAKAQSRKDAKKSLRHGRGTGSF